VVCGDFNIDRDSALFGQFIADTALDDAFEGSCPPTFRAEYLPAGARPRCIDFILTAGEIKAETAEVLFPGEQVLRGGAGYVSDHVGLLARLHFPGAWPGLTPSTRNCLPSICHSTGQFRYVRVGAVEVTTRAVPEVRSHDSEPAAGRHRHLEPGERRAYRVLGGKVLQDVGHEHAVEVAAGELRVQNAARHRLDIRV
jgi:hypothetical protein